MKKTKSKSPKRTTSPSKRIIGIDLDDVLMDFCGPICAFHNSISGTSFTRDDLWSYNLDESWKCSEEESRKRVFDYYHSDNHKRALPVSGAVSAIENLSKNNTLVIVTARPDVVSELTCAWINTHFPKRFTSIHFANYYHGDATRKRKKSDVCKELGVDLFIEDSLENALSIAENGTPVLLLDSPWNKKKDLPESITRVYSWSEIETKLAK